jgi:hypothetical protein
MRGRRARGALGRREPPPRHRLDRDARAAAPLVVAPNRDGYRLVAGERPYRAAVAGRLKHVPVIVRDTAGDWDLDLAVLENIMRQDLDPLHGARPYRRLMDEQGLTAWAWPSASALRRSASPSGCRCSSSRATPRQGGESRDPAGSPASSRGSSGGGAAEQGSRGSSLPVGCVAGTRALASVAKGRHDQGPPQLRRDDAR